MKKINLFLMSGILLINCLLPVSMVSAETENTDKLEVLPSVIMEETMDKSAIDVLTAEELVNAQVLPEDAFVNENISPLNSVNEAITVTTNTVYAATVPSDNAVWVRVSTENIHKLTMIVQFSESALFDTSFYELRDTTLYRVAQSSNLIDKSDSLSIKPNGGWYYILISLRSGSRDVNFLLETSAYSSENEPNDNIHQAKSYNELICTSDSFDSYHDQDWSMLNITSPGTYYTAISSYYTDISMSMYKIPVTVMFLDLQTYQIYSYKGHTPFLGVAVDLPSAGQYAVLVKSDSNLNQHAYGLTVAKRDSAATPDYVDVRGLKSKNQSGAWDTGHTGSYHMVFGYMLMYGYIMQNDTKLGNGFIALNVRGIGENNITSDTTIVGNDGYFMLDTNKPVSYGSDIYHTSYYDVNDVIFYDYSGQQIPSNVKKIANFR